MKRIRIILNPWADRGRAVLLKDKILAYTRLYGPVEIVETKHPHQAVELAAEAAGDGCEIVAAAGGDGTVHEVVNGLMRHTDSMTALGVLPIGSGNDFAYGNGLLATLDAAVESLYTGPIRRVDLAQIEDANGRSLYVNNSIGIGFDATVTIQSQTITRVYGFAMYTLAALRTIMLYYRTPHLRINFDNDAVEQDTLLLAIGVGPRAGGGFYLTPDAKNEDDLLDSCMVNPVGRLTMLWMLPKVMKGTHITSRHVTMRRNQTIVIESDSPLPVHVDGEIFAYPEDDVRHLTITSLRSALPLVGSPAK